MHKTLLLLFILLNFCFTNSTPIQAQEIAKEAHFTKHACIPGYGVKKRNNSSLFQGNNKKKKYFEGWYFKMVSDNNTSILSIIPGISLSENGEKQHAFIQFIDGKTAQTSYYTFPIETFKFSKKDFAVKIGDNYFSEDKLVLNIKTDSTLIHGTISMLNRTKLRLENKKEKDIMGWYRFVPFMQCYHGVVSLNHNLNGQITINNKVYDFNEGKGYIEKDWGRSMPSDWIWMQSNNFSSENTSFMLSIANIPWLGSSFTGFLGFFLHEGKVQRFATYTHSNLQILESSSNKLKIKIKDKNHTYIIEAFRHQAGILKAPVKGSMDRRIAESIDAKIRIQVMDKNGSVIFKDSSLVCGLETVGDLKKLSANFK